MASGVAELLTAPRDLVLMRREFVRTDPRRDAGADEAAAEGLRLVLLRLPGCCWSSPAPPSSPSSIRSAAGATSCDRKRKS